MATIRARSFGMAVAAAALTPLQVAVPFDPSNQPHTVREQMRTAAPAARNKAFGQFLQQHGKLCSVSYSVLGGRMRTPSVSGDVWSVRCTNDAAFAILIANDAASTSWFMPCDEVERRSAFRCFGSLTESGGAW